MQVQGVPEGLSLLECGVGLPYAASAAEASTMRDVCLLGFVSIPAAATVAILSYALVTEWKNRRG